MSSKGSETGQAWIRLAGARSISQKRRSMASSSPEVFARVYLAHHTPLPPSPMHAVLYELAREASGSRGRRIAIAAPRGHAKSTVISLASVLWSVLYGHEAYVLLASATQEQARQLLRHIRDELEANRLLRSDFPEILPEPGARQASPWRSGQLRLRNGALLHAVGVGQQIRGLRNAQHRPGLIVADDLEAPENVLAEEQRRKTKEWFEKTLLKAGDARTNVFVVGTVLHHESLLAGLLDQAVSPGWIAHRYRALLREPADTAAWSTWENIYCRRESWRGADGPEAADAYFRAHSESMTEGAEVLWPEKDPIESLMQIRVREGRASFDSEKQNEPTDPEQCVFRVESFRYWDDEFRDADALIAHLAERCECVIGWDPSLGKAGGDHSAIVLTARDIDTEIIYVLLADIARRTPQEAIMRIVQYAGIYRVGRAAVESNGFQELLQDDLSQAAREAGVDLCIEPVSSRGPKRGRIEMLEPAVSQGRIRFNRSQRELIEQLRRFPLGRHDDGPDALHIAVQASRTVKPAVIILDIDEPYVRRIEV